MSIKGQKRRFTSFAKVPLPKELYKKVIHYYPGYYGEFLHRINSFYGHGSIEKTIKEIEKWLDSLPKIEE